MRRNEVRGARRGSARALLRGGVVGGAARRARRRIARAGGPFVIDARLLKAWPFDSGFVLPPSCAVPGSYSRSVGAVGALRVGRNPIGLGHVFSSLACWSCLSLTERRPTPPRRGAPPPRRCARSPRGHAASRPVGRASRRGTRARLARPGRAGLRHPRARRRRGPRSSRGAARRAARPQRRPRWTSTRRDPTFRRRAGPLAPPRLGALHTTSAVEPATARRPTVRHHLLSRLRAHLARARTIARAREGDAPTRRGGTGCEQRRRLRRALRLRH